MEIVSASPECQPCQWLPGMMDRFTHLSLNTERGGGVGGAEREGEMKGWKEWVEMGETCCPWYSFTLSDLDVFFQLRVERQRANVVIYRISEVRNGSGNQEGC